ncbi:MAG: hypothetical protein ACTJLM_01100 [Ehrlichia sp.]
MVGNILRFFVVCLIILLLISDSVHVVYMLVNSSDQFFYNEKVIEVRSGSFISNNLYYAILYEGSA